MPLSITYFSVLPAEVWEQAIDWLVAGYTEGFYRTYQANLNYRRDLSSCALVCRAWRVRAQMHLFTLLRIPSHRLCRYEAILQESPILGTFAKEFCFFNTYTERSTNEFTRKTVETISHAVRIVHKLPGVRYLMVGRVNLAIEHPRLARHMAALTNINRLEFLSLTPTKLSQLARILVGIKTLSTLYLKVPITVDCDSRSIPTPCYAAKSSLTRLDLIIQSGGHLLLCWLVKAGVFATSLQISVVRLEDQIPQPEIALVMQGIQALLDNCAGSLKEWHFWTSIQVNNLLNVPKGNTTIVLLKDNNQCLFQYPSRRINCSQSWILWYRRAGSGMPWIR